MDHGERLFEAELDGYVAFFGVLLYNSDNFMKYVPES
jgi:hypothetical protein